MKKSACGSKAVKRLIGLLMLVFVSTHLSLASAIQAQVSGFGIGYDFQLRDYTGIVNGIVPVHRITAQFPYAGYAASISLALGTTNLASNTLPIFSTRLPGVTYKSISIGARAPFTPAFSFYWSIDTGIYEHLSEGIYSYQGQEIQISIKELGLECSGALGYIWQLTPSLRMTPHIGVHLVSLTNVSFSVHSSQIDGELKPEYKKVIIKPLLGVGVEYLF